MMVCHRSSNTFGPLVRHGSDPLHRIPSMSLEAGATAAIGPRCILQLQSEAARDHCATSCGSLSRQFGTQNCALCAFRTWELWLSGREKLNGSQRARSRFCGELVCLLASGAHLGMTPPVGTCTAAQSSTPTACSSLLAGTPLCSGDC